MEKLNGEKIVMTGGSQFHDIQEVNENEEVSRR